MKKPKLPKGVPAPFTPEKSYGMHIFDYYVVDKYGKVMGAGYNKAEAKCIAYALNKAYTVRKKKC